MDIMKISEMEDILSQCFNLTFLNAWSAFIDENQIYFENDSKSDFTIQQHEIYLKFIEFIETTITAHSRKYDISMHQFFSLCQTYAQDSVAANTFLFVIPLVTEFEAFNDVMTDRWISYFL